MLTKVADEQLRLGDQYKVHTAVLWLGDILGECFPDIPVPTAAPKPAPAAPEQGAAPPAPAPPPPAAR